MQQQVSLRVFWENKETILQREHGNRAKIIGEEGNMDKFCKKAKGTKRKISNGTPPRRHSCYLMYVNHTLSKQSLSNDPIKFNHFTNSLVNEIFLQFQPVCEGTWTGSHMSRSIILFNLITGQLPLLLQTRYYS